MDSVRKKWLELAMTGAAMGAAAQDFFNDGRRTGVLESPRFMCKDCSNCPDGNKTFCKTAGHHVNKYGSVMDCQWFERNQ